MIASDLIPLEDAAQRLGIEPKRLLGFMYRNGLGDPIGGETEDGIYVYEWSLDGLRKRLTDTSDVCISGVPSSAK